MSTVTTRVERGVLFAEIAAPPMNLLGPELVRDLVSHARWSSASRPATRRWPCRSCSVACRRRLKPDDASDQALASRRGSFQFGRTKWQVYPSG